MKAWTESTGPRFLKFYDDRLRGVGGKTGRRSAIPCGPPSRGLPAGSDSLIDVLLGLQPLL
jgi:hypothetical protein